MAAFAHAMPLGGLFGGVMIGLAAAAMLLGLGRIAGVSGLFARSIGVAPAGAPWTVALAFVAGLPLGALVAAWAAGGIEANYPGLPALVTGGLLVGFGTRLGSGCTSGHGVCGLARLAPRSILATLAFMASGFVTVGLLRAGGLL